MRLFQQLEYKETTISPLAQGVQADSKSVCSSEEQGVGSIPTGATYLFHCFSYGPKYDYKLLNFGVQYKGSLQGTLLNWSFIKKFINEQKANSAKILFEDNDELN